MFANDTALFETSNLLVVQAKPLLKDQSIMLSKCRGASKARSWELEKFRGDPKTRILPAVGWSTSSTIPALQFHLILVLRQVCERVLQEGGAFASAILPLASF